MILSLLDEHPESIAEGLASFEDPKMEQGDSTYYRGHLAPLIKNSDTADPGDRVVYAVEANWTKQDAEYKRFAQK
jgi:hypothetical protein